MYPPCIRVLGLAAGVNYSCFGHDEFEQFAPGLHSPADAGAIRNKVRQAFEQAEAEEGSIFAIETLTFG
jgi:NADH dehydrogenase